MDTSDIKKIARWYRHPWALVLYVGLIVIMGVTASDTQQPVQESKNAQGAIVATATPRPIEADAHYPVVKIIDGDTIKIDMHGTIETVRLIGINTPETVDPRRPVQCFGKEASDKAREILTGTRVRIEQDPTQGERDKYGRLLAYVFLKDGTNVNRYLIEQGYAYEYTYDIPYKYQLEFKSAQIAAKDAGRGLWAPDACV